MVKYNESGITGGWKPITNIEYPMLNVEGKKMLAKYFLIKSDTTAVYFVIQYLAVDIRYYLSGMIAVISNGWGMIEFYKKYISCTNIKIIR